MGSEKKGGRPGRGKRLALIALLAAIALAGVWLWRTGLYQKIDSAQELRALIDAAGPLAGAVYFLLQLLTVIIAPIPSNITMMAGAMALGFWPSALLGIAAIWAGSMLVFLAARHLGQEAVQGILDRGVLEKYLPMIEKKQDMFLFLTLLFPFFPDDMLCIVAGLSTIRTERFFFMMLLARPWGLLFSALLGSGALALPLWAVVPLGAGLCAVFVLAMTYSERIESALLCAIDKITRGKGKNGGSAT